MILPELPTCSETWADEIGCEDDTDQHRCVVTGPHLRLHVCRCGAYVQANGRRGGAA